MSPTSTLGRRPAKTAALFAAATAITTTACATRYDGRAQAFLTHGGQRAAAVVERWQWSRELRWSHDDACPDGPSPDDEHGRGEGLCRLGQVVTLPITLIGLLIPSGSDEHAGRYRVEVVDFDLATGRAQLRQRLPPEVQLTEVLGEDPATHAVWISYRRAVPDGRLEAGRLGVLPDGTVEVVPVTTGQRFGHVADGLTWDASTDRITVWNRRVGQVIPLDPRWRRDPWIAWSARRAGVRDAITQCEGAVVEGQPMVTILRVETAALARPHARSVATAQPNRGPDPRDPTEAIVVPWPAPIAACHASDDGSLFVTQDTTTGALAVWSVADRSLLRVIELDRADTPWTWARGAVLELDGRRAVEAVSGIEWTLALPRLSDVPDFYGAGRLVSTWRALTAPSAGRRFIAARLGPRGPELHVTSDGPTPVSATSGGGRPER